MKTRQKHGTRSGFRYKLMAFGFKLRDILHPRKQVLAEIGVKAGSQVLDYGCGPGGYVLPMVKLIGKNGTLYALDINPMAIEMVKSLAAKHKLSNVRTILSGCDTGLKPGSIDVVLLYDILHHLKNDTQILKELHRVLKPQGILSVNDHHMEENQIISQIIQGRLFKLKIVGKKTTNFNKVDKKK
ncbi:MAG: class I SAM-dependent methyltransferase [Dehalococcoidales bacterium]|nr:class I SAM-dependent methyltransferase [Dehalococcoidales bacterium]